MPTEYFVQRKTRESNKWGYCHDYPVSLERAREIIALDKEADIRAGRDMQYRIVDVIGKVYV